MPKRKKSKQQIRGHHYVLDSDGNPVEEHDLLRWAMWLETSRQQRVVNRTRVGDSTVSTVFMGLDFRFDEGPPILWETLVFGGDNDGGGERCGGNRRNAMAMHDRWVKKVSKK